MDYKIYPNVTIGKGAIIEDFAVIGNPPKGKQPGELATVIGDRAHIMSHAVIYAGVTVGDDFVAGNRSFVREDTHIGNNVTLGVGVVIEHHVEIGDNTHLDFEAGIPEYTTIEADCWIGPRALFANVFHPLCPHAKECLKGPTIKKGAVLGANVIVMARVVVGERALVGAGAILRKDVAPESVVTSAAPLRNLGSVHDLRCLTGVSDVPYRREG